MPESLAPARATTASLPAKTLAFWPALAIIAAGDFITKRIAEASLALHVPRDVVGEWIRLNLTYNTGAAMNLSLGESSRVALSAVAVVMLVVLFRMYRAAARTDAWQALALGLVAGGALGNLLDRLRSPRGVVDFIDIGTVDWRFWTFNVADSGVTVGAVLLALVLWRTPEPVPAAVPAAVPAVQAPPGTPPSPDGA